MRLSTRQLKQMLVETVAGEKIGHISGIILETDGQLVAQYEVKSSIISSTNYLISRDQIARFEDKKIIVDNSVKQIANDTEKKEQIEISPEPAAMRKSV